MAVSSIERLATTNFFGYSVDLLHGIGRGSFGTVFRGHDDDGNSFAIKKVSKYDRKKASTEAVKFHLLKKSVLHENIIKVHNVKNWEHSIWIVMEYCDLEDRNKFFEKYHRKLDTNKKVKIMSQISKGIAFLHTQNIVHRDIKPGNILLKSENAKVMVKLGNFGLSKFLDPNDITSSMSSNVGTQWFQAPEF